MIYKKSLLVVLIATVLFSTLLTFITLYSLNKGFTIWDEGYYLASYEMAKSGFYNHFTNAPFIINTAFGYLNLGIIGYRILHLVLIIFASLFFTNSIIHYITKNNIIIKRLELYLIYFVVLLGSLISYHISIKTISYNSLNEIIFLLSQGFLLKSYKHKHGILFLAISGFIAGIDAFIKPTSFVCLIVINYLFLYFTRQSKNFKFFAFGVLILLVVSLASFFSIQNWKDYIHFISIEKSHSSFEVVKILIVTGLTTIFAPKYFLVLASNLMFYFTSHHRIGKIKWIFALISLACIIKLIFRFYQNFDRDYSTFLTIANLLIVSTLAFFLFAVFKFKKNINIALSLIVLALNPIMLSLGTVNGISNTYFHGASWFALFVVGVIIIKEKNITYFNFSIILIITVLSIIQILKPLNKNEVLASEVKPLENLYIEKNQYIALKKINNIFDKHPEVPKIAFFDIPAINYLIKNHAIRNPWLTNLTHPMTIDDIYNCKQISSVIKNNRNLIVVMQSEEPLNETLTKCFLEAGFPTDFKLLEEIPSNFEDKSKPFLIYIKNEK